MQLDKRTLHKKMLAGKFTVNIKEEMPFPEKVNAYANEALMFYLY